jgi:signal transduction histidine kinase/ActR/RegA family two-component response regulator
MNKAIEAEKRAKLLLDTSPTSCFLLDEDFNAIDCNQAAVKLFIHQPDKSLSDFGFVKPDSTSCQWNCETCLHNRSITCISRKRLTKNAWKTFCIDDGKDMGAVKEWLSKQCRTALQDGANYFEHEHMTLYGERVPCAVTIVPVSYQNKTAFAYYLEDFREAAKMFAEIHKREVAEGESRAKTRFLARMSHEIRTPMNAVLGIAGFQLRKKGHPSDTEEAFTRIYNSSSLLLTIINDILDLSKVEAGKLEFVVEEYNVPNCILDTVQLNIMHVGTKKVEFKLAVDGSLPVTLLGDELRIKQILNNLLSNAFKYTKEGTVLLTFGFEETVDPGEIFLVMKVSDTGQGMTNEQIDKLFDIEFTRFNIKTNRAIEGSGLGMSITRSLVEMMHGEITVESEPGAGTAFTVRLPQKIKDWQVIGDDEAQNLQNLQISQKTFKEVATPIYEAMPYGKVLAVDDVDTNLYVVRGILAPYKIAVETVSGGREAVEKIKDGNTYDIIFMDHMMPDVDGVEATKMIRELGYEEPIVALTANAFKDIEEMFMNNGFNGFISKPINIEQLHTYIVKFVRDKYPPEVREAAKALHRDEPTDIDKFFDFFEDD